MGNLGEITRQLEVVPQLPGCYEWKDAHGNVLYVGKAKSLRNRMKQYVIGADERAKIPMMMAQVASFDYFVCDTETEALVLEKTLIQSLHPPFNADYRDDKSYPFIALTKGDAFPAVKYTREKHKPQTRYFGPYTDARAARSLMDTMRKIVPICSATCAEHKRLCRQLEAGKKPTFDHPCFDYHVGLGTGPCCDAISSQEYVSVVKRAERFLEGHRSEFIGELEDEMQEASSQLDFEHAARIRDRLVAISKLNERQKAIAGDTLDADFIAFYREETITGVCVLVVREGRILAKNEFILDKGLDIPTSTLMENFILKYYDDTTSIPRQVVLEDLPDEAEDIEDLLTMQLASKHGAKVHIEVPKRGEKRELLSLAQTNAKHTLRRFMARTSYEEQRINDALLQLESALALPAPPMRIECFDISTLHGRYSVASMVVFTAGRKDVSQYRRFKIRMDSPEANDFAMMQEVIGRRYAPKRMADVKFGSKPDLLIVDGGKPQLTAAIKQLTDLGLDIPVAGLAKSDEELFVPWSEDEPIVLPSGSPSLYLVKQVRDEAHRFAITFHRELRGKSMSASLLDDITGLGPKKKKTLLAAMGGIRKLKVASAEEIAQVPGITNEMAQDIYDAFADLRRES